MRFLPPDRLLANVQPSPSLPLPDDGSLPPWVGAIAIHWMALCRGIKSVTVAAGETIYDVSRDDELCKRLTEVESAYWNEVLKEGDQ